MRYRFLVMIALLISVSVFAQDKSKEAYPFENEIKAYKHQDSLSMPKPGGILFIGSSSIRKWTDLPKHYPDKPLIMRGVGGSKLTAWVTTYMPFVVYPYKPAKIFVYAGDNDLAAGRSVRAVYDDFVKLYSLIREQLPDTEFYFLSLKLSPSRAKYYNEVAQVDKLVADYLKGKKKAWYIDVNTTLLNPKALPDSALFQKDMLHLNTTGYDKWEQVIGKYL